MKQTLIKKAKCKSEFIWCLINEKEKLKNEDDSSPIELTEQIFSENLRKAIINMLDVGCHQGEIFFLAAKFNFIILVDVSSLKDN